MRRALVVGLTMAWTTFSPVTAHAASNAKPVAHFTAAQAATLSKAVERDLASRGVEVAMVFRTGRPRADLPPGIAYTHGAFWVHQTIRAADGRELHGYAVYNLYQGDGEKLPVNRSYLAQDYPLDFMRGSAADDVAVIVPTPEMQRRLIAVIESPLYGALHNPSYSLIANPLSPKHQNCTGFMLDVVAAAAWEARDSKQIRANLGAHFRPSVVRTGPLERMFGPVLNAGLRTDDQSGSLRTATYESLVRFMSANRLVEANYVIPSR